MNKIILSTCMFLLAGFATLFAQQLCNIEIANPGSGGLAGVTVEAYDEDGNLAGTTTTDANGSYIFTNLPFPADYTLSASKDDDPIANVTTLDIVKIARHVLAIDFFNTPYQIFAADVNDSGSITTLDVVLIKRVILGIDAGFPVPAWKFIPESTVINDPDNPFSQNFDQDFIFEATTSGDVCIDLKAIKLGNVTN